MFEIITTQAQGAGAVVQEYLQKLLMLCTLYIFEAIITFFDHGIKGVVQHWRKLRNDARQWNQAVEKDVVSKKKPEPRKELKPKDRSISVRQTITEYLCFWSDERGRGVDTTHTGDNRQSAGIRMIRYKKQKRIERKNVVEVHERS